MICLAKSYIRYICLVKEKSIMVQFTFKIWVFSCIFTYIELFFFRRSVQSKKKKPRPLSPLNSQTLVHLLCSTNFLHVFTFQILNFFSIENLTFSPSFPVVYFLISALLHVQYRVSCMQIYIRLTLTLRSYHVNERPDTSIIIKKLLCIPC